MNIELGDRSVKTQVMDASQTVSFVTKPRILIIAYGGGHMRAALAVAQYLHDHGLAQPIFMGLTTARVQVVAAGWGCFGFADFVRKEDGAAVAFGKLLAEQLAVPSVDLPESAAYLGLNYADLVAEHGAVAAQKLYAQQGRQCFLPVPTMRRILQEISPDALLTTSAPRAERAAILAAKEIKLPALCLVDLFAMHEIAWLRETDYANCLCVLNSAVKQKLVQAGRNAAQVVVTGNPAFDSVNTAETLRQGLILRRGRAWADKTVILWAAQVEPLQHPSYPNQVGDPNFPDTVLEKLRQYVAENSNAVLVVRPHPSQAQAVKEASVIGVREWISPSSEALHPLLHAVDTVVTISSTVAIEARLAGKRVVQVLGSLYSESAPYVAYGIADVAVRVDALPAALTTLSQTTKFATTTANGSAVLAPCKVAELEKYSEVNASAAEKVAMQLLALLGTQPA